MKQLGSLLIVTVPFVAIAVLIVAFVRQNRPRSAASADRAARLKAARRAARRASRTSRRMTGGPARGGQAGGDSYDMDVSVGSDTY